MEQEVAENANPTHNKIKQIRFIIDSFEFEGFASDFLIIDIFILPIIGWIPLIGGYFYFKRKERKRQAVCYLVPILA